MVNGRSCKWGCLPRPSETVDWHFYFLNQKMECFQEAHVLFFKAVGGVYKMMVYDNMRVAVKRLVGTERINRRFIETIALL